MNAESGIMERCARLERSQRTFDLSSTSSGISIEHGLSLIHI